jgi:hypothetical protein
MMQGRAFSSSRLAAAILFLICAACAPAGFAAGQSNRKEIVSQARQASYSLRRLGLVEFQCNIKPNWEPVLREQLKTDPASGQAALKLLDGLHFAMTLDRDGRVKVTHQADQAAPNEKAAEGHKQICDGLDLAMSGFFDTWSPFMLTSAFPEVESEYRLEDLGNGYRLSYKEGDASVVTDMTRDFGITEILVSSASLKSSLKPHFTKTRQGFVLAGYEATYTPASGLVTHLNTQVDYQSVSGLQLPHKLNLDGVYEGTPFAMELLFTDFNVKLR